jgi:hypothetical protein
MLNDRELDELARAVAALGDEDAGRLDDAVRERRRAKAEAEEVRLAALRTMSDFGVVREVLSAGVDCSGEFYFREAEALQVLRDAGFVRADLPRLRSAHATVEEVFRRMVALIPELACPPGYDYATMDRLIRDAAANLSAVELKGA